MSALNKALNNKLGSRNKVYRFASQALLDTPRPRKAQIEIRKSKPSQPEQMRQTFEKMRKNDITSTGYGVSH
jgi:hypothetical protein